MKQYKLRMQLRPVKFPVEDGQLLTQREILCREGCSGDDQALNEQKVRGDEDHKCEANHGKKDEPDDRAEWLMISLAAGSSRRVEVFGRDRNELPQVDRSPWSLAPTPIDFSLCENRMYHRLTECHR
jgi:hypothetical protein